jgi:hypothetical protein
VNRQEVQLSESRQLSSEFLEQQRRLRDAEDELQAAHKTNKDLQVLTHTYTYIQTVPTRCLCLRRIDSRRRREKLRSAT